MGSCCCSSGSQSQTHRGVVEYKNGKYKLPKIIVTSQDAALIYLDPSPTNQSKRLRNSLIRKFPNLISCDGEKRIIKQIEMMNQRKYYIICVTNIQQDIIKSMIINPKIKAIYFSLQQIDLRQYPNSSKIKGFYRNQADLKKDLYYHMRLDESY